MPYSSFSTLLEDARRDSLTLAECIQNREALDSDIDVAEVRAQLAEALQIMREAILQGSKADISSRTGLTGGDAAKLFESVNSFEAINVLGPRFTHILAASMATVELNAAMGRIVAAPTAGASGVLPGIFLTLDRDHSLGDEALINGLLVAGAIGACFAAQATLSGAAGGCQAEVGTAAAMTAAAVAYMLGVENGAYADRDDTPKWENLHETVGHAASFTMQGQLGLVCDPVAGLVEVPCIARNATGAAVALAGAQMALAGLKFPIPFDEVVDTASRVGAAIPPSLRETAKGGLAVTPTAKRIACELQ
ncbi:MAG: L-serine ammonia-lyase, iron-sulfur-dependent, subunit alpha [Coriobacteriia bacterium]|nr:L-serine ammonia-lyase, iron-sulfur-dependent, subunit alpha [Coriobacteriia bacterium]MCL2745655.1 L-serine ammonia-lyase, iron-sulfur-dependent, subunit alpha [Coriobacteriia bacterium]MCL2871324.1 L-serine ammonia-lyase, iron-sulfur-dependent, subunit alpha [Coriobacteriia bacterium]